MAFSFQNKPSNVAVTVGDLNEVANNTSLVSSDGINSTSLVVNNDSLYIGSESSTDNKSVINVSSTFIALGSEDFITGNDSGVNISPDTIQINTPKIYLKNVPAYDDDAAAGVGGLSVGDVYQTTGDASAPLNVAGILMIKQ
jgi:hypothetical protein